MTRRTIAPAYWGQDPDAWRAALADPTVAELVVNVNSGPGTSPVPELVRWLELAAHNGIRVAGYVAIGTGPLEARQYGTKPTEKIVEEAYRWRNYYGPDLVPDVFFDEIPPFARLGWLRPLHRAARYPDLDHPDRKTGRALFNPGAPGVTRATMLALPASVWCRWEGPGWLYLAERPRSLFLPSRTWHLVHTVSADQLEDVFDHARRAAGLFYVTTDGPDGNPWDSYRRQ